MLSTFKLSKSFGLVETISSTSCPVTPTDAMIINYCVWTKGMMLKLPAEGDNRVENLDPPM